jgi:hypothetical protein
MAGCRGIYPHWDIQAKCLIERDLRVDMFELYALAKTL